MPSGPESPSGVQFRIEHGTRSATFVEVGGGIRTFESGGSAVLWPYPETDMCSGGRGQILAPWPNRLEDGTYTWDGLEAEAALDEPARHNAIHGLVRWLDWSLIEQTAGAVTLACSLAPQPGYPFRLLLRVSYELSASGLLVTLEASNDSQIAAPFGAGFHPYLDAGPGGVDDCAIRLMAGRHLLVDDRGLPRSDEQVAGTGFDFSEGKLLDGVELDDCFTDLGHATDSGELPSQAAWSAALTQSDGRQAILWGDAAWRYLMCFTGDSLEAPDRRKGVALEPMTCPPNAFRSGEGLVVLEPDDTFSAQFGIVPLP